MLLITGISGRRKEIKKAPIPKYNIFSFKAKAFPAGSSNSIDSIQLICGKNTGLNIIRNNLFTEGAGILQFLPKLYPGMRGVASADNLFKSLEI